MVQFATGSNGEVIEICLALKKKQARLNRYQHMMARREIQPEPEEGETKVNAIYRKVANL